MIEVPLSPLSNAMTHMVVDGVRRQVHNNTGRPIHWSEEGIRNFWRWFGNSQAIDSEGRPMVMYHGTTPWEEKGRQLGDVTVFNRKASTEIVRRQASIDQVGIWLSDTASPDCGAGVYCGNSGAIYPLYLRILDAKRTTYTALTRTAFKLAHGEPEGTGMAKPRDVEPYRTWTKEMGYDGLRIIHDPARESWSTEFMRQNCYVAFDPEQIKSAIGNSGRFDPASPSIDDGVAAPSLDQVVERVAESEECDSPCP
jgi:hypothetical protein